VDLALDATVFIEVDRIFSRQRITTSGTGFAVHEDGYFLTNNHVVSSRITLPDGRRAKAKVLEIRIVINSGKADERVVEASIVTRDSDDDLALLKARHKPDAWIDWTRCTTPKITDEIWVVGYPLGGMLGAFDERTSTLKRPTVSVNSGRITALRNDAEGNLKVIQTDTSLNYGNSGGPAVDGEGNLVGVVVAKISGADGLGFVIPMNAVTDFLSKKSIVVRFEPPRLYRGMGPLRVTVEPVFSTVSDLGGSVEIEGGNTPALNVPLKPRSSDMFASITLTDNHVDAAVEGLLRAKVSVTRDGQRSSTRTFRLRGMSLGPSSGTGGGPSIQQEVPDKETKTIGLGSLGGGTLSGTKVETVRSKPSDRPTVVIDNALMYEEGGFLYAEWRYQLLKTESDRQAALDYEKSVTKIMKLKRRIKNARKVDESEVDSERLKEAEKELDELIEWAKAEQRKMRDGSRQVRFIYDDYGRLTKIEEGPGNSKDWRRLKSLHEEVVKLKAAEEAWSDSQKIETLETNLSVAVDTAKKKSLKLRSLNICRCGLNWVKCDDSDCADATRPWEGDIF
jgi:S1-C subfamily serine protease